MTSIITTLKVKDITEDTATNTGGYMLFIEMKSVLEKKEKVRWDMDEVSTLSSSFLNSSIGNAIDEFGYDFFKSHFTITKYSRYQAEFIKDYIEKYQYLIYKD